MAEHERDGDSRKGGTPGTGRGVVGPAGATAPAPRSLRAPPPASPGSDPAKDAPASSETAPSRSESARTEGQRTEGQRGEAARARAPVRSLRSGHSVVPREGVAGQALAIVIAIMTFLACLTLGGVSMIAQTAARWQSDIAREVTIQIRPDEGRDMDTSVREASRLALTFEGVEKVTALDDAAAARLLEPWLGSGFDLGELPVPRLLTVSVRVGATPDFPAMRTALAQAVPGATLDDHGAWVDRLTAMAFTTILAGIAILALVLVATVLTVVFATRGAMAGNRGIIEVLHFVGADSRFIASEFQRHFLVLGLKGAFAGGLAAMLCFLALAVWTEWGRATPQADQMTAMFGDFAVGLPGYAGMVLVAGLVAGLAALTSRFIVMRHAGTLETYGQGQA